MANPLIYVVMPVYHSNPVYLREAIDSILNQTFRDFEFLIICDEPTYEEIQLLSEYKKRDARIFIFYQPARQGLISSLNRGMAFSKGKYIARMDADDISYPYRLQKQFEYMEAHPEVGVCGTGVKHITPLKTDNYLNPSTNAGILACMMLDGCPMVHPSVMMRTEFIKNIKGPYQPGFSYAEDYYLWIRCMGVTTFHNMDEILLVYRSDGNNICARYHSKQQEELKELRELAASYLGFPKQGDKCRAEYLHELFEFNTTHHKLSERSFNRILSEVWYNDCLINAHKGLRTWFDFWSSQLSMPISLSAVRKMKFFGACLLRKKL